MPRTLNLPELGENIDAADVIGVLVEVGQTIAKEDSLIEVESEKSAMEIPAEAGGTIVEIHVALGDRIQPGAAIVSIEPAETAETAETASDPMEELAALGVAEPAPMVKVEEASDAVVINASEPEPEESVAAPQDAEPEIVEIIVTVPPLGDGIDSAEVIGVLVAVGDEVELEQGLVEVESEKASMEIPSTAAGLVTEVHLTLGDKLVAGVAIVTLQGVAAAPAAAAAEPVAEAPSQGHPLPDPKPAPTPRFGDSAASSRAGVPASPKVRRIAREFGVEIAKVEGSGPRGRVTIDDIKGHAKALLQALPTQDLVAASASAASAVSGLPPLPDLSRFGPVRRERMSGIRRATAKQMRASWLQAPRVTHSDLADITDLEALRQRNKKRVEAAGGKLTITAILAKVCAVAIERHPKFAALVDVEAEEIIYRESTHIGIAVDTPKGLLVPVLRDVARMGITQIATEIGDLAVRARDRKLAPEEMQGGCFTISNLGGIGGTGFTPIVNWPEVAILGVSRGRMSPVWDGEQFEPRLLMPLDLSYDHRLIDGAEAARFVRFLVEALEEPFELLL